MTAIQPNSGSDEGYSSFHADPSKKWDARQKSALGAHLAKRVPDTIGWVPVLRLAITCNFDGM
jgi:hypothetical protein